MSGDELFVTVAATAIAAVGWILWFVRLDGIVSLRRPSQVWPLRLFVVIAVVLIAFVLFEWSADDVRTSAGYLFMYCVLGFAWLRLAEFAFAYMGISARDDVAERSNAAAMYAIGGALLAVACCYSGGNVGNGPGWWVVVFSAALATGALFLVWRLADAFSNASDAITIDRDEASGLRFGALLLACGAIFGRAVAGDWHSAEATVIDFGRFAWPAIGLLALAVVFDTALRPTVARPKPPVAAFGAGPALIYLAAAVAWIFQLGWPS